MKGSELYEFIYDWANLVLNTPVLTVQIIQAFQNTPAPAENYLAIPKTPTLDSQGMSTRTAYKDSTGVQSFIIEYEASITIREIGGSGDNLSALINSLDLLAVRKLFADNQVSLLRHGSVASLPRLNELLWKDEFILPLTFLIMDQVDDTRTWIELVNFEPNYKTQGD